MEVRWNTKFKKSPIIFQHSAEWSGIKVFHRKALAGEITEYTEPDHEINISIAGQSRTERHTSTGKKIFKCNRDGNICVLPTNQPHKVFWEDNYEALTVNIAPKFIEQVARENNLSAHFELFEANKNDLLIPEIGFALLNEFKSETPVGKLYTDSLLQTRAIHILKNYTTANFPSKGLKGGLSGYKLNLVKEYINDNLAEDLSVVDLAKVAGLSRFHFTRAFRKSMGLTPQKYFMQQRIERAKILLSNKKLQIVEVSLQTGFKNQSHFTTLFRKWTKLTPGTWRYLKHA